MVPLSSLLEEACAAFKPRLDPSCCQLVFNKKPLDLATPFRLANIPNGSRIDVIKGMSKPSFPRRLTFLCTCRHVCMHVRPLIGEQLL